MKKFILLFVVILGMTVLLCSCDCKHKNLSPATCTDPSICSDCGETISAATGHTDGEWITDKEANCTEDGSKHQVCSVCEATIKTETLTKLGHADGQWITDKEANCTEDGSKHQVCSVCDATIKTETLTKLGHTEVIDSAVSATCTVDGKTEGKHCSGCSKIIVAQTVVKALGHTEVIDPAIAATCEAKGKTEGKHCSICDVIIIKQTDIAIIDHDYQGGACTMCKAVDAVAKQTEIDEENIRHQEKIDSIDSFYSSTISALEQYIRTLKLKYNISYTYETSYCRTLISNGVSEISRLERRISALSGSSNSEDIAERRKLEAQLAEKRSEVEIYYEHIAINDCYIQIENYELDYQYRIKDENTIHKANLDAIEIKYTCASKGHTIVIDEAKEPTCTVNGRTEGSHCSVCHTVLVATQTITATGHNYDDWKIVLDPTCENVGQEERTCATCNFEDYKTIDTIAHNYGDWKTVLDPTCENVGKEERTCTICNSKDYKTVVAVGHNYINNWCTVCNQVDPSAVYLILKNHIKSNGTESSTNNYCLLLGTTQVGDFKYERKNYYNALTDMVILAVDVYYFEEYQWTISVEIPSVQSSYKWRYIDLGAAEMIGTFTASSFYGSMYYMPYTSTNIISSQINDIRSMGVYFVDYLLSKMKVDYNDIGLQPKNFGFSQY